MNINLYIDSIIIQIANDSVFNSLANFKSVVRLLSKYFTHVPKELLRQDKLSKFNNMYIIDDKTRDYSQCLALFSFTENIEDFSWFSVYARKEGVYIELHSLVQYMSSFTQEKLFVLHLLYKKYTKLFSFSRLDIAIDIKEKFLDLVIYDKNLIELKTNTYKSTKNCSYFQNRNAVALKAYNKTKQRNRRIALPYQLIRVELTIKRSKLKTVLTESALSKRIKKELSYYHIFIKNEEVLIHEQMIDELVRDFYSVLVTGRNTLRYANKYKNMKKQAEKAYLSYECFKSNTTMKTYAQKNNISYKTLRKHMNFYKAYFVS